MQSSCVFSKAFELSQTILIKEKNQDLQKGLIISIDQGIIEILANDVDLSELFIIII